MSIENKKLYREIDLHNLLKTESRVKWEAEHKICYGLYDREGLESLTTVDEITVQSLDKIITATSSLKLRARMNSQRDCVVFIVWLHKNYLQIINSMLEKENYMRARNLLIKHGHVC